MPSVCPWCACSTSSVRFRCVQRYAFGGVNSTRAVRRDGLPSVTVRFGQDARRRRLESGEKQKEKAAGRAECHGPACILWACPFGKRDFPNLRRDGFFEKRAVRRSGEGGSAVRARRYTRRVLTAVFSPKNERKQRRTRAENRRSRAGGEMCFFAAFSENPGRNAPLKKFSS